jgi:tetratricopeptide (TPR) repeat protein
VPGQSREFEEARNTYGKVIRSSAGEGKPRWPMADRRAYFHQRNFEAALREYLRVDILYAYPAWQALALIEAAKCHDLLHDYKQAEQCYRRILDRYGDTPSAKEAKQRIEDSKMKQEAKDREKRTE